MAQEGTLTPLSEADAVQGADPRLQAVLDGLLFGFGDEALGVIQSITEDVSYEEARDANRKAAEQYQKDNPGAALGLEIVGSLPYMFVPGAGWARTGTLLARLGKTAFAGSAAGALAGFGEGEGDALSQATSAATGAALGGVTALGADRLLAGGEALARKVFRGQSLPEQAAAKQVSEALIDDGMTPQQLTGQIRRNIEDGVKPETIADLGDESLQLAAERAAQSTGPVRRAARETLGGRADSRYDRVSGDIKRVFGNRRNYYETLETLDAARRTEAGPLYDRAYAFGEVDDEVINELLSRPYVQEAWRRGAKLLQNETGAPADAGVTVQMLDYTKRGLDEMIASARTQGLGPAEKRVLVNLKDKLLARLDEVVTDADGNKPYTAARAIYSGIASASEALESGRGIWKMDPEQITRAVKDMSAADKDAFLEGVTRALTDRMDSAADGRDLTRATFGSAGARKKIRAAVSALTDDKKQADAMFGELEGLMKRERNMARTDNRMLGGSPTARRTPPVVPGQTALEVAGTGLGLPGAATAVGAATQPLRGAFGRATDDALGRGLFNPDPAMQQRFLDNLAPALPQVAGDVISRFGKRSAASVAGQQAPGLLDILGGGY
jgi:hypothetical protein